MERDKSPPVVRVRRIGMRTRALVETLKQGGAREEELMVVLLAVIEELERDVAKRRRV